MKITPEDYERMRSWMAHLVPEVFPKIKPEHHPIEVLDRFAAKSPANARKGLAMAVGDIVAASDAWPPERVSELDGQFRSEGLPTLSEIRAKFSKDIQRIIQRGHIRSEIEYYAVRNAADFPGGDQEWLWALLEAYENQA